MTGLTRGAVSLTMATPAGGPGNRIRDQAVNAVGRGCRTATNRRLRVGPRGSMIHYRSRVWGPVARPGGRRPGPRLTSWFKTLGIDDAPSASAGHHRRTSLKIYSRLVLANDQQTYNNVIGQFPV